MFLALLIATSTSAVADLAMTSSVATSSIAGEFTADISAEEIVAEAAPEEVVITGKSDPKKETAVLRDRRRAAVVSDAISAQEIARTPDSNAADAAKRVVAVTVVEDKYVLLRGLGGRYVSTLLNGVVLPSPEPDEQAVPLDLFPTALLSRLSVAKSYSAELPGTFGGGALLIDTNSYPKSFDLKIKLSGALDTSSTFRDGLHYSGGSLDYFGFDDGTRNLPDSVPNDRPLAAGLNGVDQTMTERAAEAFDNTWSVAKSIGGPNVGLGLTMGDTITLGGKKLGYLGTISFGHKTVTRRQEVGKAEVQGGALVSREQLDNTTTAHKGSLGGLLNLGLKLDDGDELSLFTLYTHTGEQTAERLLGYSDSDRENLDSSRLLFVERGLLFSQLRGKHLFFDAGNLELDWQGNASLTHREEPDTRDVVHHLLQDGRARFVKAPGSGERFFSHLLDVGTGGSAQLGLPLDGVKLALGAGVQRSSRTFSARRFRFDQVDGSSSEPLFLPTEEMLSADRIGPDFYLEEKTLPTDEYDASLLVAGAHASADMTLLDPLRVIAGLRVENATQKLEGGSPYAQNTVPPEGVDYSSTSFLPTANFVYALTEEMNLRAAYSYTLARPQFRELAPFLYFDFTRRRSISGNPELRDTRIHNGDLRWEWFFGSSEVLAASVFYKQLRRPIEKVISNASNGDLTYANADGAIALGGELEVRTTFEKIHESLWNLRAGANLTVVRSEISLTDEQKRAQTNQTRPMQGQSPYVINFSLGYLIESTETELSASYNVFGKRIAEVGINTQPDVYERPFHRLDFSATQTLGTAMNFKLSATNLLNQSIRLTQGDVNIQSYRPGVAVMAALEWTP